MILLLSLLLFISPVKNYHPFFVSVTEIEYLPKDRVIGVSCKVFNDDFENTLKNYSGKPIDILKGDKTTTGAIIFGYFQKHFSMSVDGKPVSFKLLGYENEGDASFIYLETPATVPPRKVVVTTDFMYDYSHSQINMLHYIQNGQRQSHKISYPDKEVVFDIQQ